MTQRIRTVRPVERGIGLLPDHFVFESDLMTNLGRLTFVMSPEILAQKMAATHGRGTLVDDGTDLWWEQENP